MAQLIFTIDEAFELARLNDKNIDKVSQIACEGDMINFRIKMPIPLMPNIPVSVRFIEFNSGQASFEVGLAGLGALAAGAVNSMLSAHRDKIPPFVKIEFPHVQVDVNKMLAEKVRGLEIEKLQLHDGCLTITTK